MATYRKRTPQEKLSAVLDGLKGRSSQEICAEYRSEERRVGKECALLCRSRWSPYH